MERRRPYHPTKMKQTRLQKPAVYTGSILGSIRTIGRRALVRALVEEYQFGNSVSKLYVSLLAQAMVAQDPKLMEKMSYFLGRCGVRQVRDRDYWNAVDRAKREAT